MFLARKYLGHVAAALGQSDAPCLRTRLKIVATRLFGALLLLGKYLLAYYFLPTVVSAIYTLLCRKWVTSYAHVGIESSGEVRLVFGVPSLKVPGGTELRDLRVYFHSETENEPLFGLALRGVHKWKHLQGFRLSGSVDVIKSNNLDAKKLERIYANKQLRARIVGKVGICFFFWHWYVELPQMGDIKAFETPGGKTYADVVHGSLAHQCEDFVVANLGICPNAPSPSLRLSCHELSLEAFVRLESTADESTLRELAIANIFFEPFRNKKTDDIFDCSIEMHKQGVENMHEVFRSLEGENAKAKFFFRISSNSTLHGSARELLEIILGSIVVESSEGDEHEDAELPLIALNIEMMTKELLEGSISVHRNLFFCSYLYEIAKNVDFGPDVARAEVKVGDRCVADLLLSDMTEDVADCVSLRFCGKISNFELLLFRTLYPHGLPMVIAFQKEYSLVSHFLSVKTFYYDFRSTFKLTGLGYQGNGSSDDDSGGKAVPPQRRNSISISSNVSENGLSDFSIVSKICTNTPKTQKYMLVHLLHDRKFVVNRGPLEIAIRVGAFKLYINFKESVYDLLALENDLFVEIDVKVGSEIGGFESLFSMNPHGLDSLVRFLLFGRDASSLAASPEIGHDDIGCPREDIDDACSMPNTIKSVKMEKMHRLNSCEVKVRINNRKIDPPLFLKLEINVPQLEINIFPHSRSSGVFWDKSARVRIYPFRPKVMTDMHKLYTCNEEISFSCKIDADLSSRLFTDVLTFRPIAKDTPLSQAINFCLGFTDLPLEILDGVRHEKRRYSDFGRYSEKPLYMKSEVILRLPKGPAVGNATLSGAKTCNYPSVNAVTIIKFPGSQSNKSSIFTLETEDTIVLSLVGLTEDKNLCEDTRKLKISVSPLGINVRQDGNENYAQRNIEVAVEAGIGILLKNFDKFRAEAYVRGKEDQKLSRDFGREILGVLERVEKNTLLSLLIGKFLHILNLGPQSSSTEHPHKAPQSQPEEALSIPEVLASSLRGLCAPKQGCQLNSSSVTECGDSGLPLLKGRLVLDQGCKFVVSSHVDIGNSFFGSMLKRINLREYPMYVDIIVNLRLKGGGSDNHVIMYGINMPRFPVLYTKENRWEEKKFDVNFKCGSNNKTRLYLPKTFTTFEIIRKHMSTLSYKCLSMLSLGTLAPASAGKSAANSEYSARKLPIEIEGCSRITIGLYHDANLLLELSISGRHICETKMVSRCFRLFYHLMINETIIEARISVDGKCLHTCSVVLVAHISFRSIIWRIIKNNAAGGGVKKMLMCK